MKGKIIGTAAIFGLALAISMNSTSNKTKAVDNLRKEAAEYFDSAAVKQLEKNAPNSGMTNPREFRRGVDYANYWNKAVMEAKVKEAYRLGQQAVRDSLKTANLKKIALDSITKIK